MKVNRKAFRAAALIGIALLFSGCGNAFLRSGDQSGADAAESRALPGFSKTNDWAYLTDAPGDDAAQGSASGTSGISVNSGSGYTYGVSWDCGPGKSKGWCYGKGWNGAPPATVYYSLSTLVNPQAGCSGLYGWASNTSDGYVEFYVCETVGWIEGPHNNDNDGSYPTYMGSYVCDGCTYDFYRYQRFNKPNPKGSSSFYQWIAVNRGVNPSRRDTDTTPGRLYPRMAGKISIRDHFAAWKNTAAINKKIDNNNNGNYEEVDWTVYTIEAWKSADTSTTSKGSITVTLSDAPFPVTATNINLHGSYDFYPTRPTMCMSGSSLTSSTTIDPDDADAIFTKYVVNMTQISYPWASFPGENYTHYGEVVAFKNGGYFLTVDDSGNVVRSSKSDVASLTDAEKFVYDNNYGYCDFISLKTKVSSPEIKGFNRLDTNGKCPAGNLIYGNFSIDYRDDTPPQPAPPNYYRLNNNWSERMLTVADTSGYANVLSQALNTGWASQQWRLEEISGGPPSPGASVRIRNIWSGKYLTVKDTSDYADVKAQDLNTGWTSQVWVVDGDLSQARFKNVWSGKYLTVTGQGECAAVKCQPFNSDWPSQVWRLQY